MDDDQNPGVSNPSTATTFCKDCGQVIDPEELVESQEQEIPTIMISSPPIQPNDINFKAKLNFLNSQLAELISISKKLVETDIKGFDIKEFTRVCEDVSTKIKNLIITESATAMQDFQNSICKLKHGLHEVINITQAITDTGTISPAVEKFGNSCASFKKNVSLCSCLKLPDEEELKSPSQGSVDKIKDVVKTKHVAIELKVPKPREVPDYMKKPMATDTLVEINQTPEAVTTVVLEGQNPKPLSAYGGKIKEIPDYMKKLTKPLVITDKEEFNPLSDESQMSFTRIEEFKNHVDEVINMVKYYQSAELLTTNAEEFIDSCESVKIKIEEYKKQRANKQKLQSLKEQINLLEKITSVAETDELTQASMNNFLSCCKEFKSKLEDFKTSKRLPSNDSLEQLVSQIDDTILLSEEAKKEGLVSDSVDKFIKGCQEIKARIEFQDIEDDEEEPDPKVIEELSNNIENIMNFISKYRDEGLISPSIEEFFKTCEVTKAKLSLYKEFLPTKEPLCKGVCLCGQQDPDEEPCEKCKEMLTEDQSPQELPPPPCNTCQGIENNTPHNIYKTYYEELDRKIEKESLKYLCNSCKRKNNARLQESDDSSNDDYEKKVRKITRVRRYKGQYGNIKEKREIITIRKQKNDPHETILIEDETEYDADSYDSVMNDIKRVGMCVIPQTQGFLRTVRQVKSADPIKDTPWVQPILRKQNVLSRVIIPRIVVTMRYIVSELDEQEREETFRLKRFKELKYKHKMEAEGDLKKELSLIKEEIPSKEKPIPKMMEEKIIDEKPKMVEDKVKDVKPIPEMIQETVEPKKIIEEKLLDEGLTDKISIPEILRDEKMIETLTHTNICACCLKLFAADDETGQRFLCPLCQLKAKAKEENQALQLKFVRCPNSYSIDDKDNERLEHLKAHMNEAKAGPVPPCMYITDDAKQKTEALTYQPSPCGGICAPPEQRESKRVLTTCTSAPLAPAETVIPPTRGSRDTPMEAPSNTFKLTPVPKPKLGYFEKKYKEIVKVTRLRNPDGSVSEEKQVITIKTERRMPKSEEQEGSFKEQQYIGTCAICTNEHGGRGVGGGGYGREGYDLEGAGRYGGEGGGGNYEGEYKSCKSCYDKTGEYDGPGGYETGGTDAVDGYNCTCECFSTTTIPGNECNGYAEGGCRNVYPPIETKSEASNRSPAMGEPNLRACASASYQNKGMNDLSISSEDKCVCFEISNTPPPTPSVNIKVCPAKASKTTSVDSKLYCPEHSRFICSTELASGFQSPKPPKCASKSTSIQTCCCCFLIDKIPTADKASACKPTCTPRPIISHGNKCVNTDLFPREICTTSSAQTMISSTTTSCNGSCSKRKSSTNAGCPMKIISKSPKSCSFDMKDVNNEVVLKGSILNALRKIILPSSKSTQCSLAGSDIQLCPNCLSKLASSSGQKCQGKMKMNPACFICQMGNDVEKEEEFHKVICDSCGTIGKYSSTLASVSVKSAAVGSSYANSSPDISSKSKQSSDKSLLDYQPTCSSLAQTIRSVCLSCPSYRSSEICCPKPKSVAKVAETKRNQTKDAMTSTKRSDRYDCRPLKGFKRVHACEKIRSRSCACHSDSHMLRPRCPYAFHRSQSCYEDIYFFK